ncbi:MAG TPA: hypothetical protein VGV69_02575 [Solirubrobacterales bacterium]|nr:hypothetical protein [Solirubrobacterales bacterium]
MASAAFPSEQFGREFARWLAPYVAEVLRGEENLKHPSAYDAEQCRALARELGVNSLHRSRDFFAKLDVDGSVDSLTMARYLSLGTPRNIASAVTTPIKRIAKRLGLGLPWDEDVSADDRTVWRDRNGIAGRMLAAIDEENERRFPA